MTSPATGAPVGRRVILGMIGLGGAGILWGAKAADLFGHVLAPITAADRTGLSSFIPAAGRFRIYSVVSRLPRREAAAYRLRVTGLVDRPLDLSYDDLKAMKPLRLVKDFQCVTGWRVESVPWEGVLLADLLDAAGAHDSAGAVTFKSFDGVYTESLTIEQARRSDVMVAYAMQDKQPIPAVHGGPVRLYVAPMYGYKSLKWLEEIEVVADVELGYWEVRGYDVDAWIGRSNGRNDDPNV